MVLKTAGTDARFKPRPIEGVTLEVPLPPDALVLDGQQRLTALYQALLSGEPTSTFDSRRKRVRRWYYIDIAAAVDDEADREDAIRSVPEGKVQRTFRNEIALDLSTPDLEYQQGLFPLSQIFRPNPWRNAFHRFWERDPARVTTFDEFDDRVLDRSPGTGCP
jgi:hypothetical protein